MQRRLGWSIISRSIATVSALPRQNLQQVQQTLAQSQVRSWLDLCTGHEGDLGVDEDCIVPLQRAQEAGSISLYRVPIDPLWLEAETARQVAATMSAVEKPVLVSSRSSTRAQAALLLHEASSRGWGADKALDRASELGFGKVLEDRGLVEWIIAGITSLTKSPGQVIFRQLFERESCTYTYIVGCATSREAVVIDPVDTMFARDRQMLEELCLEPKYAVDTHLHEDHMSAAGRFSQEFSGCASAAGVASGIDAELQLEERQHLEFGANFMEARATPGHTPGCVSLVMDDRSAVFTGDSLLIRGCGQPSSQVGSSTQLFQSVREQLMVLPKDTLVYPAHNFSGLTCSSVGEEANYNPLLGFMSSQEEFEAAMGKKQQTSQA
ncbi:unnamed protein product [Chrysoparadoxa australica]